jgi:PleD family two-component response regulator
MVNVDREGLEMIAERLRMLVAGSGFDADGNSISVTISVGGTIGLPGDTETSILQRADRLMYVSKRKGRDRVTVDSGEQTPAGEPK